MFDVYLSHRRDHLLVVEKGQPIPIDQHLGAVAQEKSSRRSQRRNQDGGAERRLLFATTTRAAERHVRRATIRPVKIELAGVLIWCQRFQTIQLSEGIP